MASRLKIRRSETPREKEQVANRRWDRRQPIPEPKAYGGHGPAPSRAPFLFLPRYTPGWGWH